MNKKQYDYIIDQLDKMQRELESVTDAATRATLRGKYIELFIDLSTISNIQLEVDDEEPVEEVAEEPESVTAETEAVVEEPKEEPEEEGFDDAEVIRSVINEDGEEVDITDAFNALRKEVVEAPEVTE